MARVTIAEVRTILPTGSILTDDQITAAINASTCIVDMVYGSCGSDLTAECLKQVELYLSAHNCAVTENSLSLSSETNPSCGGTVTYSFKFGEGITGTPFGQLANTLSSGCLMQFDKTPVNMFVIGNLH